MANGPVRPGAPSRLTGSGRWSEGAGDDQLVDRFTGPGTWSSVPGLLDRPAASARHRGRDHDEDGRDDDADDPPDPVDAARRLNTEPCGQVVADEHAADPADNREPERNVVSVARRDELAEQADDDACDDHTDDVHRRPLSPIEDD